MHQGCRKGSGSGFHSIVAIALCGAWPPRAPSILLQKISSYRRNTSMPDSARSRGRYGRGWFFRYVARGEKLPNQPERSVWFSVVDKVRQPPSSHQSCAVEAQRRRSRSRTCLATAAENMSFDEDLQNSHASSQEVLSRYRGILRAQRLEAQSAEVLSRKALESLAPLQRAHGLWLGSYPTRDVNEPRIKRRDVISYWGDMPARHGLKHEADTAFRRRVGGLWKPGIRNSVDPAKRDGMRVKRLGGMVAVCKRSFDAEFADPSQGLLDRVMGRSAKTRQLIYHLRPRLMCRLRQALESPLNPPSICLVNIQRLHTLLQATANHNPQRWLLSRRQFVKLLTGSFRGFDIRTAHQLYTCYDPSGRDRVRFAQITSDLVASEHPSTLVLAAAPMDLGPHRLSLTVLRLAYQLHASATPEARGLKYAVVLEMMRSVCVEDEVAAELEEAFIKFIRVQGRNREDEERENIIFKKLVEEDALIRVHHSCLTAFQCKIRMMEDEMLDQTGSKYR